MDILERWESTAATRHCWSLIKTTLSTPKSYNLDIIAYAPTSNSYIIEIEHFYATLESINKVNKKEVILCADCNTQIENYHEDYPDIIGLYSNQKKSNNSHCLLELLLKNNLYACNTFSKHKLEQIHTWTSSFIPSRRRNPYRCQIDYIIASKNLRNLNFDSKAINRLSIDTDHKLILSKFKIKTNSRRKIYSQNLQTSKNQLNVEHLKERKEVYNEIAEKELENANL